MYVIGKKFFRRERLLLFWKGVYKVIYVNYLMDRYLNIKWVVTVLK